MRRLSTPLMIAGVCVLVAIGVIVWRVIPNVTAPKITAQQVYERLQRSGVATNGRTAPNLPNTPFADCTDQYAFDVPEPKRPIGVIFICPKNVGDRAMARPTATPDATGVFAGTSISPFTFQSTGGTVLVSLPAITSPVMAERIRIEVAIIPE